ncbi:TPA: beta-propeller fold lactonase family protein [Bacillus cereus]|nr:beta-propeller fold lactonase family protein [Bacillus cereus]
MTNLPEWIDPSLSILSTPDIPVTPSQQEFLTIYFSQLEQNVTSFVNNPSTINKQNLAHLLSDMYYFLLNNFPYTSVSYALYLILDLYTVLTNNSPPTYTNFQIGQMLQALFSALAVFVSQLILTDAPRNQLYTNLANSVTITGTIISSSGGGTTPTNVAYIVDGDGNNAVTVINLEYAGFLATISNPLNPYDIARDPVANRLYTSNRLNPGSVSIINGSTFELIATVAVGINPEGIAVNPATNTVYVANFDSTLVSVISGVTNSVTATVEVGNNPTDVAVNSTTNRIYVSNFNSNSISVIDGTNNSVVGSPLTGGSNPRGLAVLPSLNRLYVTNISSNTVSVMDTTNETPTLISTITVGGAPFAVAVNPTTNRVYVANQDGRVSVLNANTPSAPPIATVTVGALPQGISVNTALNRIYVSDHDANAVSIINGTLNRVVATITNLLAPRGIAIKEPGL